MEVQNSYTSWYLPSLCFQESLPTTPQNSLIEKGDQENFSIFQVPKRFSLKSLFMDLRLIQQHLGSARFFPNLSTAPPVPSQPQPLPSRHLQRSAEVRSLHLVVVVYGPTLQESAFLRLSSLPPFWLMFPKQSLQINTFFLNESPDKFWDARCFWENQASFVYVVQIPHILSCYSCRF